MPPIARPTREEAEAAVRTLISWAGDDITREGLLETPKRVVSAYEEFFAGYTEDPKAILSKTFEEVEDYDEMVLLKNMRLESHCEHHMVPIIGVVHVAYIPNKRVVGISKLARLVDVFGKRLQTQETMTAQIADTLNDVLQPKGVAVVVDAAHQCMTTRGVHKTSTSTITSRLHGLFKSDPRTRQELMTLISSPSVGNVVV
jgi:GTP cyclohydrolase IA